MANAKPARPSPEGKIVYRFTGGEGDYASDVPARDLEASDVATIAPGALAAALASGLYAPAGEADGAAPPAGESEAAPPEDAAE